ncbi:hypothetical protein Taro_024878 [Colocasia esculenta]|uniref:Uncharacterized protein n=1 Tax=Colocasia esculenta TaxID=4460 RepID=A0A843VIS4_COLES|nr:hypothetical protein [Colocasia esculenta]
MHVINKSRPSAVTPAQSHEPEDERFRNVKLARSARFFENRLDPSIRSYSDQDQHGPIRHSDPISPSMGCLDIVSSYLFHSLSGYINFCLAGTEDGRLRGTRSCGGSSCMLLCAPYGMRGTAGFSEEKLVQRIMQNLGIYARLDQVFDAPPAVKEVLNSQCPVQTSYVGTRETDQRANEVLRLGIADLWTPDCHYRWSKSRYGGHISAFVDPVQHSRLFLYNSNVGDVDRSKSRKEELEVAINEMDGSVKLLQMERRQLEDEAAKLQKQRNLLVDAISLKWRFAEKQMMSIELDTQGSKVAPPSSMALASIVPLVRLE